MCSEYHLNIWFVRWIYWAVWGVVIFNYLLPFSNMLAVYCPLQIRILFCLQNWRHLFLKRNYAISQSDKECTRHNYLPDMSKKCSSSCFMMYLNGTDRTTGRTVVLGKR